MAEDGDYRQQEQLWVPSWAYLTSPQAPTETRTVVLSHQNLETEAALGHQLVD